MSTRGFTVLFTKGESTPLGLERGAEVIDESNQSRVDFRQVNCELEIKNNAFTLEGLENVRRIKVELCKFEVRGEELVVTGLSPEECAKLFQDVYVEPGEGSAGV
jgi:hypothetical protein